MPAAQDVQRNRVRFFVPYTLAVLVVLGGVLPHNPGGRSGVGTAWATEPAPVETEAAQRLRAWLDLLRQRLNPAQPAASADISTAIEEVASDYFTYGVNPFTPEPIELWNAADGAESVVLENWSELPSADAETLLLVTDRIRADLALLYGPLDAEETVGDKTTPRDGGNP